MTTLINERELAKMLGVSVKTLQVWRWRRRGPPHLKMNGRLVRYSRDAVESWLAGQRRPDHGGRGAAVSERTGSRIKTLERLEHG